jgi:hypothetical protein
MCQVGKVSIDGSMTTRIRRSNAVTAKSEASAMPGHPSNIQRRPAVPSRRERTSSAARAYAAPRLPMPAPINPMM